MTQKNNADSLLTSRRTVVMGGLATLSIGALAGCGDSGKKEAGGDKKPGNLAENVLGSADAPVTLIEYSSMTCPHCANFHTQTLPDLKKKYIETGKVRYIVREFPLDPLATAAFMLARCSGKEKFFPLVEALYANQRSWTTQNPLDKLLDFTKQAGFTQETFNKCLNDKELEKQVLAVKKRGVDEFGVRSTPTFFINGEKYNSAHTVEAFEKVIDPLLGEKK